MILKPCTICGVLSATSRCPQHQRPNSTRRGYGARWRRASRNFLAVHWWCEVPGCGERAVDVHHRDGLGPRGPRGYDERNMQALCHAHHSSVTASGRPGA